MGARVLIVDDEKWIGFLVGDDLTENGYEVTIQMRLADARRQLAGPVLPEIIILDVMLPDGNGLDFLTEIRGNSRTAGIPVIMITAEKIDTKHRIHGFNQGADEYLSKPFNLGELRSRMERLIKRGKTGPAAHQSSAPLAPATPLITPLLPPLVPASEASVPKKPSRPLRVLLGEWFTKILLTPVQFFEDQVEPSDYFPFGLIVLFSIFMGLQNGVEEGSVAVAMVSLVVFTAVSFSSVAVVAWVIQWIAGLLQQPLSFKKILDRLCYGFAPLILSSFLGFIYVLAAKGRTGEFTAGLQLLFPAQGTTNIFGFILRRFDLFEIWALLLMALGFSELIGAKRKPIIILFGLVWFFGIVTLGALIKFF